MSHRRVELPGLMSERWLLKLLFYVFLDNFFLGNFLVFSFMGFIRVVTSWSVMYWPGELVNL